MILVWMRLCLRQHLEKAKPLQMVTLTMKEDMNIGQGCTVEGCAYMCSQIENCKSFSVLDLCYEDDNTNSFRPTCATVDRLVSESGGFATFDRSKRAVCSFH